MTPHWVVRSLEAGRAVPLDAPGWTDTVRSQCPDCDRLVMTFKFNRQVLFTYGIDLARPHVCGQVDPPQDHPDWLKLEAVNRELSDLARHHEWEQVQAWWGPGR